MEVNALAKLASLNCDTTMSTPKRTISHVLTVADKRKGGITSITVHESMLLLRPSYIKGRKEHQLILIYPNVNNNNNNNNKNNNKNNIYPLVTYFCALSTK